MGSSIRGVLMKGHTIPLATRITAVCGIILVVCSCSQLQQMAVKAELQRQFQHESQVLKQGQDAFFNAEFQAAERIFEQLAQQATHADIVHAALYGMACSRYAQAQTPAAIQDALEAWNAWYQVTPVPFNTLDPRMMAPMMQTIAAQKQFERRIEGLQDQLAAASAELSALQAELEKRLSEMASLQTQQIALRSRHGAEIEQLNGQIANLAQENTKLRNQLKALQAIEQGIKAKKKVITSQ
jgi:DNA repair exonuclease SbcCD ATPase subunit